MEPYLVPIYKDDAEVAKNLHDERKQLFIDHFKSFEGAWDTWEKGYDASQEVKDSSRAIVRWLFNLPAGTKKMKDPGIMDSFSEDGFRHRVTHRVIETEFGKITLIKDSTCKLPVAEDAWEDDYYARFGEFDEELAPWVVDAEGRELDDDDPDEAYLSDEKSTRNDTQEDFVRLRDGLDTLQHIHAEFLAIAKPKLSAVK